MASICYKRGRKELAKSKYTTVPKYISFLCHYWSPGASINNHTHWHYNKKWKDTHDMFWISSTSQTPPTNKRRHLSFPPFNNYLHVRSMVEIVVLVVGESW